MRTYRGRFWWAVGISLACHAVLTSVFLFFSPDGRPARASANAADLTISAPEYQAMTVQLDDPPPRIRPQAPATPPAAVAKVKPAEDVVPKQASARNAAPTDNQPKAPTPSLEGNGSSVAPVAPLHGPLTRAGFSVVYVLDRSGSMAQAKKLAFAVALLKASLRKLGPDVRFQIVTYDSQAVVSRLAGGIDLVRAEPSTISQAEQLLEDLAAEGSSRHAEGLRAGLTLRPDLLILLSDAGDLTAAEVKLVKQWNQKGTAIHAVLLGTPNDEDARSLRDLTGSANVHFVPLPEAPLLMP